MRFISCGVSLYCVVVGVWWYLCLFVVECVCSVVVGVWWYVCLFLVECVCIV